MEKSKLCTTLELSKLYGVSRSEILKYVSEGMPIIARNKYNFIQCSTWLFGLDQKKITPAIKKRIMKVNMELNDQKWKKIKRYIGKPSVIYDESKKQFITTPEGMKRFLKIISKGLKSFRMKKNNSPQN